MGSKASSVVRDSAKSGSSWWESENMDPNGEDRPAVRIFVAGENSGAFQREKENLFRLSTNVEDEGFVTREAVSECLNIDAYAKESAKVAERRAAAARRKAKGCASFDEAEHHSTTAENLCTAAKLTTRRAKNLNHSLQSARTDANSAVLLATKAFLDLDKTGESVIEQHVFEDLDRAKENAIRGTATLKEDEYLVLNAMKRCWERSIQPLEDHALQEDDANPTTPLVPRDQMNYEPRERILMTLAVISFIAGCIMIILSAKLSLDKYFFIAMLVAGIVCTLWPLGYFIYEIKHINTKSKLAYLRRRNPMLNFINERLAELNNFFTTKHMPIPSDEDEENNPITRSPR